ncbi:uncharacterized protein LOC107275100 isoform X2 [Cephus cinctus]|uniref:Uncharacterized protein LOC107275100 isoform X2 n=1 Tax=Cephus cinctus TaxID=211228 RepID=A0AAJ7VWE2_CEPCN|nr:uncharacterized protein LOC107275100 isoform X2 [Cephus cinctus]
MVTSRIPTCSCFYSNIKVLRTVMKKSTKKDGVDSSKRNSKSRKAQTTENTKDARALPENLGKTLKSKTLEEMIAAEGSVEKLIGSEGPSTSVMEFNDLTPQDLQDSLIRARENPVEPFKFLCGILDDVVSDQHISVESTKATDIDLQLAALTRRIELNRNLLDMTNQRVKEINYLTEKNKVLASRDLAYDEECFLKLKEAGDPGTTESVPETVHPGIDELRRTMDQTREMLRHVKKISNREMKIEDLPQDLVNHMSPSKKTSKEFKLENTKFKDKIQNQSVAPVRCT